MFRKESSINKAIDIPDQENVDSSNVEKTICSLSSQRVPIRTISRELGISKRIIRIILKKNGAQNNRSLAAQKRWGTERDKILAKTSSPHANQSRSLKAKKFFAENPHEGKNRLTKARAELASREKQRLTKDFGHDISERLNEWHLATGHTVEEIATTTGRMPESIRKIMSTNGVKTGRIDQKSNRHFEQVQQIVWSRPESLQALNRIERRIISQRYLENPEGYIPSYADIAHELGISRQAVHQREKAAMEVLKNK